MIERHPAQRGLGCGSVIPAGLIGIAGLADHAGPGGWLGFAEFVGWIAACVAAGLAVSALLGQWRRGAVWRYASVILAVFSVAAFTYAPYWLGLDAPMRAKVAFTTTLQVVGSAASVGVVLWLGWLAWSGRRI